MSDEMDDERGPRINADKRGLMNADTTEKIIGVFYDAYNELGYGFL